MALRPTLRDDKASLDRFAKTYFVGKHHARGIGGCNANSAAST